MSQWNNYPFLRYLSSLILGIWLYGSHFEIAPYDILFIFCGLAILYLFLVVRKYSLFLSGIAGLLMISLVGYAMAYYTDERKDADHLSHVDIQQISAFSGWIVEDPIDQEKYVRYIFRIDSVLLGDRSIKREGKIQLHVRKEVQNKVRSYDSYLYVSGSLLSVKSSKNPMVFDYAEYLSRQHIYHQAYVRDDDIMGIGTSSRFSIRALAFEMRHKAKDLFQNQIRDAQSRAVVVALVLGVKDYLDQELKSAYATSGTMHVLAVSGLHMGIIFLILGFFLKPLRNIYLGRYYYGIGIILGLWLYAFITGLVPSVMRAATMFSIVSLSKMNHRTSNIYNSIALTAFVLLLIDPNMIYAVSFQLSFIAVTGIVIFFPLFYSCWEIKNPVGDYFWSLMCTSLAAQIATLPIAMYYFHQLPTYFLLSNLWVVPATFIILILAVVLLVISLFFDPSHLYMGWVLENLIGIMNAYVIWIEQLPYSKISGLYLYSSEVLVIYLIQIVLLVAFRKRSFVRLVFGLLLIIFWQIINLFTHINANERKMLVIYDMQYQMSVDVIEGYSARLMIDRYNPRSFERLKWSINPFRGFLGLPSASTDLTELFKTEELKHFGPFHLFLWQGHKIIFINNNNNQQWEFEETLTADYVVITEELTLDFEYLLRHLKIGALVIGSNCSPYYADKISIWAHEMNVPVHNIKEDGYWMLDL